MTEFKIGDRVKNISNDTIPKDECGTVVAIDTYIGVEWDEFNKGHSFEAYDDVYIKKSDHGWWVKADDIKPVCVPEISIKIEKDSPYEICQSVISALETQGVGITFKNDSTLEFAKEYKKMPRFEFKTEERTRIDKTCNGTIPIVTTRVTINGRTGEATCDKAEYDERQGVLEALANAICNDSFYKVYAEAVRQNKIADKKSRTCTYCHKVFDTVEEKEKHEAWHVECKKARRERYLLRKRAKEIAFEEQAQKMAKEMIKENK
jgi:hypothetical protein